MKIKCFFFLLLSFISFSKMFSQKSSVIPQPNFIDWQKGEFALKGNTIIEYNVDSISDIAKMLNDHLNLNPKNLIFGWQGRSNIIKIHIESGFADEAYQIRVSPSVIECKASTPVGLFYAVQSLIQIMGTGNKTPCVLIEDKPAYSWRGFMLDESRHFHGKETVKQYLDLMAKLKLNRFHWHLTDEDGWRIEIKKYPKLTTIGSVGNWSDRNAPAQFYTQDEIKEIVAYAEKNHIMVIPEIDMPGHASAATRSYPEISGGGTGRWEGFTYNPAKETTYEFFNNVLDEVVALFPAPYIHIGADEVHFGNQSWYTDPQIQQFIRDNYLMSEVGLEHYFVRRICQMVNDKGKIMIGWDEIVNTGVTPENAIVMWWRHDKPELLTAALHKGFDVIMTPRIPCYFDFVQDDIQKTGRRWDGMFNPLEVVYSYPENIDYLISANSDQVLGLQANTWTERIASRKRLDYMVFPRLLAIAEDGWTQEQNKNYSSFLERVRLFLPYLDKLGIYYYNIFKPLDTPEPYGPDRHDVIAEG